VNLCHEGFKARRSGVATSPPAIAALQSQGVAGLARLGVEAGDLRAARRPLFLLTPQQPFGRPLGVKSG
jgi:hypothetical protein